MRGTRWLREVCGEEWLRNLVLHVGAPLPTALGRSRSDGRVRRREVAANPKWYRANTRRAGDMDTRRDEPPTAPHLPPKSLEKYWSDPASATPRTVAGTKESGRKERDGPIQNSAPYPARSTLCQRVSGYSSSSMHRTGSSEMDVELQPPSKSQTLSADIDPRKDCWGRIPHVKPHSVRYDEEATRGGFIRF